MICLLLINAGDEGDFVGGDVVGREVVVHKDLENVVACNRNSIVMASGISLMAYIRGTTHDLNSVLETNLAILLISTSCNMPCECYQPTCNLLEFSTLDQLSIPLLRSTGLS